MGNGDRPDIARRGRDSSAAGGFTLVDALIAIALIGTAVGFAIHGFQSYRDMRRAQAEAERVADVLEMAASLAVSQNRFAVIDFAPGRLSPQSGFFQLFLDIDEDLVRDAGEVAAAELVDTTLRGRMSGYQLPAGVGFQRPRSGEHGPAGLPLEADGVTFEDDLVVFSPDGQPREAGTLTLADAAGRTYAVTLDADGTVRRYRWDGRRWR